MLYLIIAVIFAAVAILDALTLTDADRSHPAQPYDPQPVRGSRPTARRRARNPYTFAPYREPRRPLFADPQRQRPGNPVAHAARNPRRIRPF